MDQASFSKLTHDVFLPSVMGSSLRNLFHLHAQERVSAEGFSEVFDSNPLYAHMIRKFPALAKKSAEWIAEDPEAGRDDRIILTKILRLLGKQASRNYIAMSRMIQITGQGLGRDAPKPDQKAPTNRKNKFSAQPKELMPYAVMAEDFCSENHINDGYLAFQAGYHYDLALNILLSKGAQKEVTNPIRIYFDEGILIARCAEVLAKKLRSVKLGKFVFSAGILVPLGRVFLNHLHPRSIGDKSYPQFLSDVEKTGEFEYLVTRDREKEMFGLNACELSSLYVSFVGIMPQIEKALAFVYHPEMLKASMPDLYQLCSILSIATLIADRSLDSKSPWEKSLSPLQREWLKSTYISLEVLDEIVSNIKLKKDLAGGG